MTGCRLRPASAIESTKPGQQVRRQDIEIGAEFLEQRRYERIHDDVRVERLPDLPVVARRELERDLQVLPFDGQVFKEHWRWDRRDQVLSNEK